MASKKNNITEIITLYRKLRKRPNTLYQTYKMTYNFESLGNIKQIKYFLFDGTNHYFSSKLEDLPLKNFDNPILEHENGEANVFHVTEDNNEKDTDSTSDNNCINQEEVEDININIDNPLDIINSPQEEVEGNNNPVQEDLEGKKTSKKKKKENRKPKFWLNIFQPSKEDLDLLYYKHQVHPTSITDILEGNTDEKVDIYSHYTFISLKLTTTTQVEDIDLNIMIFNNCIITTHNNFWEGINDILNFLVLLIKYTRFRTEWVVFSILVEVLQEIKFKVDIIEEDINIGKKYTEPNSDRATNVSNLNNVSSEREVLDKDNFDKENFDKENFEKINIEKINIEKISGKTKSDQPDCIFSEENLISNDNLKSNFYFCDRISCLHSFLKGKKQTLRTILCKSKKINDIANLNYYFTQLIEDFNDVEEIIKDLHRKLERQQDLLLALLDVQQSTEANEMSRAINRFALVTFVFLPCQTIAGLWGMNVKVPWQDKSGNMPFWILTFFSFFLSMLLMVLIFKKEGKRRLKRTFF